jgi:hypothetical protein
MNHARLHGNGVLRRKLMWRKQSASAQARRHTEMAGNTF